MNRHGSVIPQTLVIAIAAVALLECRGEPTPRDYQNTPPAVTHPVTSSADTPTAHGMSNATPQTGSGGVGTVAPYQPVDPTSRTTTLKDQSPSSAASTIEPGPPVGNSQHVTQTTSTAVTGTHLAPKP